MKQPGPERVKQIFDEAADLPPAERSALLALACAGDEQLQREVESLLRAMEQGNAFLGDATAPGTSANRAPTEEPGTIIGRYRLLELIGEGGFGSVFMAEQREPVARRVALKVIKVGMDTRQVVARFEAERQALAIMDHPNIARALDAGTTDTGRPFFVMELVKGDPITGYCDAHSLATRKRLELFVDVCHAVQHAHTKGIIHRDIKPSNVLVTIIDGRPVPKVIDFGIAKAMSGRLTEKTLFTEFRQFVGTPEYMSPEQAALCGTDIDTRSDIYSLGVLLYELLTGVPPFDPHRLRSAAWDQMLRIIREVEPSKPSTRLSEMKGTIGSVAARRDVEPARLRKLVKGDLDWIVMKCLEKERGRRYETASGLAADIDRHLHDEAVLAAPPSRVYRLRRFMQRHRVATLITATVAAAVTLGLAGTTWGVFWALEEQNKSDEAATRAEEEAARFKTALALVGQVLEPRRTRDDEGQPLDFIGRLTEFEQSLGSRLENQPEVEAEVRPILGRAFALFLDHDAAERQFERTLTLRRAGRGELDPSTGLAVSNFIGAIAARGDFPRALEVARDCVDRAQEAAQSDHAEVGERLFLLAQAYEWAGDSAEADAVAGRSLALLERIHGRNHRRVADCVVLLAFIARQRSQLERSVALYEEGLALYTQLGMELDATTSDVIWYYCVVKRLQGDSKGAAAVARSSIERARQVMRDRSLTDSEYHALAERLRHYADFLSFLPDREEEALAAAQESLTIESSISAESFSVAQTLRVAGYLYAATGRLEESERCLRDSMRFFRAHEASIYRREWMWAAQELYYTLLIRGGDLAEAEALARECLAYHLETKASGWIVWYWRLHIALCCLMRENDAGADEMEREALASAEQAGAFTSAILADRLHVLGERLSGFGRHAAANLPFAARLSILERLCPDHWLRFDAASALGECLTEQQRFADAEPLLIQGHAGLGERETAPSDRVQKAMERVAALYEAWNAAEPSKCHRAKAARYAALCAIPGNSLDGARAASARFSTPEERAELAAWYHRLASLLVHLPGREANGIAALREALEIGRMHAPARQVAEIARELGVVLWLVGQFDESEALLRDAVAIYRAGDDFMANTLAPSTAGDLSWVIRDGGGDRAEAEALAREALDEAIRNSHETFWTVWYWRLEVAAYCWARGANAEAEQLESQALPFATASGPYVNTGNAHRMMVLGDRLTSLGRHRAAELPFGARAWILERLCPEHWLRFDADSARGGCFARQGKFVEAEPLLLQGHAGLQERKAAPPERVRLAAERVVEMYDGWHAAEPGETYHAKAAEWRARLPAPDAADGLPR